MQTSAEIINSTEKKEYTIARLSKDNLDDVARLHSAVYGVTVKDDYFLKKYDTAFTGVENVGFVAYGRDNQPVAYYGVIPCFIKCGDEVVLAAQSADTMTDPRHRYKGMFVELSNRCFDLCRELGIRLVFGFPNQNSYHGAVNKLGWKMTGTMSCFTIHVNSLPLESIAKKFRYLQKLYKRFSHFILKKELLPLPGVANSVLSDGFAGVWRNDEYMKYKTYSPAKVIRVRDTKIWISDKSGLLIGDMEGVNEMNFSTVLKKLKGLAKKLGVRQLQFHCSPGTALHQLFAANCPLTPSYPILFHDFGSAIPPEKVRFTFADIDIF